MAEARIDLAICYLREGALDEARVTLQDVLSQLEIGKQTEMPRPFDAAMWRKRFGSLPDSSEFTLTQRHCLKRAATMLSEESSITSRHGCYKISAWRKTVKII